MKQKLNVSKLTPLNDRYYIIAITVSILEYSQQPDGMCIHHNYYFSQSIVP